MLPVRAGLPNVGGKRLLAGLACYGCSLYAVYLLKTRGPCHTGSRACPLGNPCLVFRALGVEDSEM